VKVRQNCNMCNRPFWVNEKETDTNKREYCQKCRNLMNMINQKQVKFTKRKVSINDVFKNAEHT